MKSHHITAGLFALAIGAGSASAQIALNEIYISMSGADTLEFVELKGPAGASLDGHVVLVVEGDFAAPPSTNTGTLDRAWDLTGQVIPTDGYYVLGDTAVTNKDFDIGLQDRLENGTNTFYLVQTANPGALVALVGTNIVVSGTTTQIPTLSTIVDSVGVVDNDPLTTGDVVYDGAIVIGPDASGPFLPAGILRECDAPNPWSNTQWLDFDPILNLDVPQTPGAQNVLCNAPAGTPFCFGDGSDPNQIPCPCANTGAAGRGCANSIALSALLAVSGATNPDTVTLNASDMLPTATNIYLQGNNVSATGAVFGDGVRCVAGQLLRLAVKTAVGGASQYPDPNVGDLSITARSAQLGFPIGSAETRWYQTYYRDPNLAFCAAPPGNSWNVTNGIFVVWP